ncbi:MAG: hypothetical protein HY920_09070 [Elusimicrobia bacterium]|nr:hypothetical protein [Elusimicrobiota bacterium]
MDRNESEIVSFTGPAEPGVCRLKVKVRQGETICEAEAVITVVEILIKSSIIGDSFSQGLPGYTLESAPGKP